jgi:hypothetical protein
MRVQAAAVWLMLAMTGTAGADVLRPMDERATARLLAEEVARQAPEAVVDLGATRAWVVVQMPDGTRRRVTVDKLHAQLREAGDGAARKAILEAFVADLVTAAPQEKGRPAADWSRVMPVIRWPAERGNWGQSGWAKAPWVEAFFQCWVLDQDGAPISCLRPGDLRLARLGKLEIAALGLANLEARLGAVTETTQGRFHRLSLDGRFGSSLMLLPEYWAERAGMGQLVAAIPTADLLIWIADPVPAELSALRTLVGMSGMTRNAGIVLGGLEAWQAGASPEEKAAYDALLALIGPGEKGEGLSPDLYSWTGAGWETLPE